MRREIFAPDLGNEASIVLSLWYARPGEWVREGERLVELLVGDAAIEVAAPVSGVFREKIAFAEDRLSPGQLLGFLEDVKAGEY